VIDGHNHVTVFCGAWLCRSAMCRQVWRRAVNGSRVTHTGPTHEWIHFHDTRHPTNVADRG
jgi:hypothetical protein